MQRILTVNLPEALLEQMNTLVEEYGLYPSRSELVRYAIREFLQEYTRQVDEFDLSPRGPDNPDWDDEGILAFFC